ncbi:Cysteine-rich CWC [Paracidovorax valerianellae]|uniref:Cysteine-rich CWC n=2 Tax=Paracidovorax valerianellae TaxID=187868 RepID=A0A1G7AUG5_9BURK|nr:Cysteine-rich CWC [Paracidovorax valerianellae]
MHSPVRHPGSPAGPTLAPSPDAMTAAPPAPPAVDPSRCPLCGLRNGCAIEAGAPAADCWCMAAPVSPEALARLAPAQRGIACLCPACAAGTSVSSHGDAPVAPI